MIAGVMERVKSGESKEERRYIRRRAMGATTLEGVSGDLRRWDHWRELTGVE